MSTPSALGDHTTGGCLCGAVRFCIVGDLRDVLVCHCSFCQKQHTHAGAYTACAAGALHLTSASALRWYQSSAAARRGFCGECGAGLFWAPTHGRHISISVGSLDRAPPMALAGHIFVGQRSALYEVPAGAPQWDGPVP